MTQVPCDATERAVLLRAEHSSARADTLPEHRLMIALVRDAIRCIEKYRNARDFRSKRLFEQDCQWMLSDDTGWIYAFARVCETLNLEPDAVRIALGLLPEREHRQFARATHRVDSTLQERRSPC